MAKSVEEKLKEIANRRMEKALKVKNKYKKAEGGIVRSTDDKERRKKEYMDKYLELASYDELDEEKQMRKDDVMSKVREESRKDDPELVDLIDKKKKSKVKDPYGLGKKLKKKMLKKYGFENLLKK